jgi:hypothetical protein
LQLGKPAPQRRVLCWQHQWIVVHPPGHFGFCSETMCKILQSRSSFCSACRQSLVFPLLIRALESCTETADPKTLNHFSTQKRILRD